jgi:hypothetical protein
MLACSKGLALVSECVLLASLLTACSGQGGASSTPPMSTSQSTSPLDHTAHADNDSGGGSVLQQLDTITTIGSTVDPSNGDQNPYGLDVVRVDAGLLKAGDLVVCNFNDSANVQGNGTTIVALHPQPGSNPIRVSQDPSLLGCDALAVAPNDNIWLAAFNANDNPIFRPDGTLVTALAGGPWHGPFGQAFAPSHDEHGTPAFYESNASDGSIVRINIHPGPHFTFDVIATGFAVNGGAPGSILGPSGLQYDGKEDRLYIVDGANNTLTSFSDVSKIPAGGITVNGTNFGGRFKHRARTVFSGPPLNGPISSALLPNGNLVLGNTLDSPGNLMVEIKADGHVLAVKNVDTGAAGALFGMVATGRGAKDTKIYFNDDNDNTVKLLSR